MAVNKGQQNRIRGLDIVEHMRREGMVKSAMSPTVKIMYYDRLLDRNSEDREEHF